MSYSKGGAADPQAIFNKTYKTDFTQVVSGKGKHQKSAVHQLWQQKNTQGLDVDEEILRAAVHAELMKIKKGKELTDEVVTAAIAYFGMIVPPKTVDLSAVPVKGRIAAAAVGELVMKDAHMAAALKAVFQGTASGRSGPKSGDIKHIHIGGIGTWNLIFNEATHVALGTVGFHIDSSNSGGQRNDIFEVEGRDGGDTVSCTVQGKDNITSP